MSASYVVTDLVRNPRRTLSTMVGVVLGVGLFCAVLFFVDGLSASMTQRAVAPLAIDMQRIVSDRAGADLMLDQTFDRVDLGAGDQVMVTLELRHPGELPANEVTIRSVATAGLVYVPGSTELDGRPLADPTDAAGVASGDSPLAQGPARAGHNLGTIDPGTVHRLTFRLEATTATMVDDTVVASSSSSRESVDPVAANRPPPVGLADLSARIAEVPGVATAVPLWLADLGRDRLGTPERNASGPTRIFGLDPIGVAADENIELLAGSAEVDGAVLSVEATGALGVAIGDPVVIGLPDGSTIELPVVGVADLSRARSLFSSRRGGDLETFIYVPNSVIVSEGVFADRVFPAFERAITAGDGRFKSPPIREVDVTLRRDLLDADPATAATETGRIAEAVMAVADGQDHLLDNITNTLGVAADDAAVAKRLFVFLGLPGALLAAMLAAYAGNVLAEAQRREQAVLRIRGASRRDLLTMLAVRTALLTGTGAVIGLSAGYLMVAVILGPSSLQRASVTSLVTSGLFGAVAGYAATGAALYLTGRRSIDREINEDRAALATGAPLWRRTHLDMVSSAVLAAGTIAAIRTRAFDGTPGSVYFGRSVQLNLVLLVLPVMVWLTGTLVAARLVGLLLNKTRPRSSIDLAPVGRALVRRSVGRRPWAIANGIIIIALIVALVTSLGAFTASYDEAKAADARYANGADIRITPGPAADRTDGADDGTAFRVDGVADVTPVIFGRSNVVIRSARTSDPANLAAVDPVGFPLVAPVEVGAEAPLRALADDPDAILLSAERAAFLQAGPGDTLHVLLGRATPDQTEIEVTVVGLYERLPGFPDGADAVLAIDRHLATLPAKAPDFFLAATTDPGRSGLDRAVAALREGPAAVDQLRIDTRATTLDRDQSSLAALNIAGLVDLDSAFALAMTVVTIAIFVFGLLLQRRREYVTLRALGLGPGTVRALIAAEAALVALAGTVAGLIVGAMMGSYFVAVLRPLFVLDPPFVVPLSAVAPPAVLVLLAALGATIGGSRLVDRLDPTELLRDE